MNRTGLIPRMTARNILLAGITGLGLSASCWAAQPYLQDANPTTDTVSATAASTSGHLFPRVYFHEIDGDVTAEQMSKYPFIVVQGTPFRSSRR